MQQAGYLTAFFGDTLVDFNTWRFQHGGCSVLTRLLELEIYIYYLYRLEANDRGMQGNPLSPEDVRHRMMS